MTAIRILLLYQDSLLAQGLSSLLRQESGLEVSARRLQDGHLDEFVRQFAPDVVIIDREDSKRHAEITIEELLSGRPGVKVVDVSSRDEFARVYEGRQVRLTTFDDLLATFRNEGT